MHTPNYISHLLIYNTHEYSISILVHTLNKFIAVNKLAEKGYSDPLRVWPA